jgi:hypothetical protein
MSPKRMCPTLHLLGLSLTFAGKGVKSPLRDFNAALATDLGTMLWSN